MERKSRGQVAVFVIIALVLVGGIAGYFAVKRGLIGGGESTTFAPVYQYYDQCLSQAVQEGVELA